MNQVVINRHSQHRFIYAFSSQWEMGLLQPEELQPVFTRPDFCSFIKNSLGKGRSSKCMCMPVIFFLTYVSFSPSVCLLGLLRRSPVTLSSRCLVNIQSQYLLMLADLQTMLSFFISGIPFFVTCYFCKQYNKHF